MDAGRGSWMTDVMCGKNACTQPRLSCKLGDMIKLNRLLIVFYVLKGTLQSRYKARINSCVPVFGAQNPVQSGADELYSSIDVFWHEKKHAG